MKKLNAFLRLKSFAVLLLISLPLSWRYYDVSNENVVFVFKIINAIGASFYMLWFLAVLLVSSEKLKQKKIVEPLMKRSIPLLVVISAILFKIIFSNEPFYYYRFFGFDFILKEPVQVYIIFIALIASMKYLISRIIISLEKGEKDQSKDLLKTWILFLIPYLGIVFVHPIIRQRIAKVKE